MPAVIAEGPRTHYYRAPYPILSFLTGLYCDPAWSLAEFTKWRASARHTKEEDHRVYLYDGYLDAYADMPLAAARIIALDVPKSPPEAPDWRHRPTADNFDAIWPFVKNELCLKAVGAPRTFPLNERLPILSSLSLVYLSDQLPPSSFPHFSLFQQVHKQNGDAASLGPLLQELAPALKAELIGMLCW